jgi:hypothetical protein
MTAKNRQIRAFGMVWHVQGLFDRSNDEECRS